MKKTVKELNQALENAKCEREEEKTKFKVQYEELKTKKADLTASLVTTLDELDELKQRIKDMEEDSDQLKEKCAKYELAMQDEKGMSEGEQKVLQATV